MSNNFFHLLSWFKNTNTPVFYYATGDSWGAHSLGRTPVFNKYHLLSSALKRDPDKAWDMALNFKEFAAELIPLPMYDVVISANNWSRKFGMLSHQSTGDEKGCHWISWMRSKYGLWSKKMPQAKSQKTSYLFYRPQSYLERVTEYQSPKGATANCTSEEWLFMPVSDFDNPPKL